MASCALTCSRPNDVTVDSLSGSPSQEIIPCTTGAGRLLSSGRAVLSVRNSGPVIPPGEVDQLFEPFRQLGADRIRHGDGYGLGLAIVRAIADAHHATLTAHARPVGGLDVTVTFPAASSTTPSAGAAGAARWSWTWTPA